MSEDDFEGDSYEDEDEEYEVYLYAFDSEILNPNEIRITC